MHHQDKTSWLENRCLIHTYAEKMAGKKPTRWQFTHRLIIMKNEVKNTLNRSKLTHKSFVQFAINSN